MKPATTLPPSFPLHRDATRRGATLLVTLGILTVLSVIAATFLVISRQQRQTSANDQNRLIARDYMDAGLYQALRQIEESFTYPNYTEKEIPAGQYQTHQRLAPVNQWFTSDYGKAKGIDNDIAFQSMGVLASPTVSNNPHVNLLTPQVQRLIPSTLTNGLQLSASETPVFRSGWIPVSPVNDSIQSPMQSKTTRIAFLAFDCSGFMDANYFVSGPTTQKLARACFNQADVTNWLPVARTAWQETFAPLENTLQLDDPDGSPFFHLSYDPDPDVYPLHYDCFETTPTLGTYAFGSGPVVNLNMPLARIAVEAAGNAADVIGNRAYFCKYNLNNITNFFPLGTESTDDNAPWFNDMNFRASWLDSVVFLLNMMCHEEPNTTLHRWPDSSALAWSIANFIDTDRIPQISEFPTDESQEQQLPTRVSYAVEDVPLINKISVFNIFDDQAPRDNRYYDVDSSLSNHYAVAVELWYPFVPNLPPENTSCYVGIYTNAADVVTTTNRPWTANDLRDWFNWNNFDNSNSVMKTLFYAWARAYTNQVGPSIAGHPLWQTVTDQGDLWFTPAMTNHPSWPVADANGDFSITNTPIWQAFYPDTYTSVSTNTSGTVTTNVYTYLNITNAYADWVSDPGGATNRLVGHIGTTTPETYPVLVWSNLTDSAITTNVLRSFTDTDSTTTLFWAAGLTNHLLNLSARPEGIETVISNDFSGAVTSAYATAFDLAPWTPDVPLVFSLQTNLFVTVEIIPVEPLPMPEDLGLALAALFLMLPSDTLPNLFDFLMLTPDQFTDDMWLDLLDYFTQNPSLTNRLFPTRQAATLGSMTEEDRHGLWPPAYMRDETVELDDTRLSPPSDFRGYFWTVYPKQTVSFEEIIEELTDENGTVTQPAVTNYHALGSVMNGQVNTVWLRPAVTVRRDMGGAESEENIAESDIIVDEALLTRGDEYEIPVWGWTSVTNLCIPDPRNNAYARDWRGFPEPWENVINTADLNTGVRELPFIHFNQPLSSIGEIGHVYASYRDQAQADGDDAEDTPQRAYDTLTFSTRSGAALLDIFTLSPTNAPRRGLVQANTPHAPVVQALLADIPVGWTNLLQGGSTDTSGWKTLHSTPDRVESLSDVYLNALTEAPYSMGWRSFADMLPSVSTNKILTQQSVWSDTNLHPMHDYTEDVLRGLADKVSFRQNIFVIVVAAQTLSPASTTTRPIVLADQRAAVTVIRDAYTGRWVIHSWVWLTD